MRIFSLNRVLCGDGYPKLRAHAQQWTPRERGTGVLCQIKLVFICFLFVCVFLFVCLRQGLTVSVNQSGSHGDLPVYTS